MLPSKHRTAHGFWKHAPQAEDDQHDVPRAHRDPRAEREQGGP